MNALAVLALAALAGVAAAVSPQMDDTTRQALLDAHNTYRAKVSPTATFMLKLAWNSSLEQIANTYTTCALATTLSHNPLHSSLGFGENLASSSGSAAYLQNAQQTVDAWASEQSYAAYPYSISSQGHWTQVIWAKTASVGCVYIDCPDPTYGTTRVWTCDYYPAGNYVGQSVYVSGTSCSACPTGTTCDSTGALCSSSSGSGSGSSPSPSPAAASPTPSPSPSKAAAASATPSSSPSKAAAASATPSSSPSKAAAASATPSPSSSKAAAASPSSTPSAAPAASASAAPAASASAAPAASASAAPAASASAAPAASASPASGSQPGASSSPAAEGKGSAASGLQPAALLSAALGVAVAAALQ